MIHRLLLGCLALASLTSALAQNSKQDVAQKIDASKSTYESIAMKIWSYAEVGYQETKSSGLLQEQLKKEGFEVKAGVAGIPTAFIARYGSGHPILAILGEFDALPGVAQAATPERSPIAGQIAGHACGHHLFGAGSAQAAAAVKDWMKATGQKGTIRFYGCPAEEGGSGKIYMVRAGLFDDVDTVLHWHAADRNEITMASSLANKSAKFRFHGIASHAAQSPEKGRSALDAVEAMDNMVNMMREHVPDTTRIHYIITHGGDAPNIVPAEAEVYYYVRSPSRAIVQEVFDRISKAAEGAAMGTGTKVDWEVISGVYELLPNEVLGKAMYDNLSDIGGVSYTKEEAEFAEKIGHTLPGGKHAAAELATGILPFDPKAPNGSASTDVGDVSWTVPTVGLIAATWVPGTPAHSWQAVACGGMSLGPKGMEVAAKTIAFTAIDLFTHPELIAKSREEFLKRRGADFKYSALLGDRKPPLDYRN
jgi:aminobenzoyl-glutamate utilization protein B